MQNDNMQSIIERYKKEMMNISRRSSISNTYEKAQPTSAKSAAEERKTENLRQPEPTLESQTIQKEEPENGRPEKGRSSFYSGELEKMSPELRDYMNEMREAYPVFQDSVMSPEQEDALDFNPSPNAVSPQNAERAQISPEIEMDEDFEPEEGMYDFDQYSKAFPGEQKIQKSEIAPLQYQIVKEISPQEITPENLQAYLNTLTGRGALSVIVFAGNRAYPITNARVIVKSTVGGGETILYDEQTDASGEVTNLVLATPPKELSLSPRDDGVLPYGVYEVSVTHDGFIPVTFKNVPIFDGMTAIQPVEMLPAAVGDVRHEPIIVGETEPEDLQGE